MNICHCACSLLADLLDALIFPRSSNVSPCSSCWKREGWYYGPERVAGSVVNGSHWPSWSSWHGRLAFSIQGWFRPVASNRPPDAMEFLLSQIKRECTGPSCYWPYNANDPLHRADGKPCSNFVLFFRRKVIISRDNQRVGWLSHFSFVSSFIYAKWKNVLHPEHFFSWITFLPVENMLINSINSYHQALRQPSSQDSTQTAVCVCVFKCVWIQPVPISSTADLFNAALWGMSVCCCSTFRT